MIIIDSRRLNPCKFDKANRKEGVLEWYGVEIESKI